MSKLLDIIFDLAGSTSSAIFNIFFMLQLTFSILFIITKICFRSLYHRKSPLINLKQFRDDTIRAKLGDTIHDD